ncbi:hypothetical protein VP1G_00814 [Cytospora mali]|uniref:Uncharacterized protein n=1 Tax=Cytospora mali TaxID=578113 RepID=A0A194UNB7_CYTMA|nr:hypothetical protein VP1G_00814 [Valsa mali var. pyri (nom. inval.)]
MASSLESPTFRWKHDEWITTTPPKTVEKGTAGETLDNAHQVAFKRAITNVLATDVAELTFAQLVDGMPLIDIGGSNPSSTIESFALEPWKRPRALHKAFDPLAMRIRAEALNRYQSTPVGSKASKLPLVELVAVTVHALAVQVFKQVDGGFHKNDKYPDDKYYQENPIYRLRKPTPFFLWFTFDDPKQYPDGVADIAAY